MSCIMTMNPVPTDRLTDQCHFDKMCVMSHEITALKLSVFSSYGFRTISNF